MALTTNFSIILNGKVTGVINKGTREANIALNYATPLLDGVLAGQADRVYAVSVPALAASGTQDIDLAGALTDPLANPAVFARVKGIVVAAYAANTNNVVVGAAATNPWVGLLAATHTITLRPGTTFGAMVGAADLIAYPVIAATGDLLRITNGGAGTTVGFDVAILGCSV